jgi:hypothetical protein
VQSLRVLITVKTYPVPSAGYGELVCTAGISPQIGFVRLYPVPFRYLDHVKQYRKYQWIELQARRNEHDPRPESYRPDCETIRPVGRPLPAGDWAQRKQIVLPWLARSLEELSERQRRDGTSLGLIRPKRVRDLVAEPDESEWRPAQRARLAQLNLFGQQPKPLTKLPFKFSYVFQCADTQCKGHTLMIADWELGALHLSAYRRKGSQSAAVCDVRHKFLDEMCGPDKDTCFFVGNMLQHPRSWLVLGVFWPPRTDS